MEHLPVPGRGERGELKPAPLANAIVRHVSMLRVSIPVQIGGDGVRSPCESQRRK